MMSLLKLGWPPPLLGWQASRPHCQLLSCLLFPPGPYKLEEGDVAMGRVLKVVPNKGLTVSFPFGRIGKVSVFHLSDSYSEEPLTDFCPQKIVR